MTIMQTSRFIRFTGSSSTSALGLGLLIFLASVAWLPATTLMVLQDSYIDGRDVFLDSNFGTATSLLVGQSTPPGTQGGRKAYLLFDASSLPDIFSIDSFQIQRGGGTVNRTIQLYAILGDSVDAWIESGESGITWNNAPGNNVTAGLRDFGAFPGESLIYIGDINTGALTDTIYTVSFGALAEADSQAILAALNTGDRKLTLGLRYNSSQDSSITFRSKEFGDGSSAAKLNVTLIPEPGSAALLLGGIALLLVSRRKY